MFAEFYHYWWLLLLLPLLHFGGKYFVQKKRQEQSSPFIQHNQNIELSHGFWRTKVGLIGFGIVLLMLAVWRPQWGDNLEKIEKKGLDIVFTVDVSKSMKALDFSQGRTLISRLDATKWLIENFVQKRKTDRIGLVEFAGESFVASPLTLDYSVFLNFLKNISSDDLGKQGTNLAEALNVSLGRLDVQSAEKRGKAIILFSDGDETISSDAKQMAKLAAEKGVKVFTVGIGSEKGSPIPEGQDGFGRIIYKKWKGETVMTALNPDPLKTIARITGGEYFHAESIKDLEKLQAKLKTLPQKILTEDQVTPQSEQYFWFTFFGLLFFSAGILLPPNIFAQK